MFISVFKTLLVLTTKYVFNRNKSLFGKILESCLNTQKRESLSFVSCDKIKQHNANLHPHAMFVSITISIPPSLAELLFKIAIWTDGADVLKKPPQWILCSAAVQKHFTTIVLRTQTFLSTKKDMKLLLVFCGLLVVALASNPDGKLSAGFSTSAICLSKFVYHKIGQN